MGLMVLERTWSIVPFYGPARPQEDISKNGYGHNESLKISLKSPTTMVLLVNEQIVENIYGPGGPWKNILKYPRLLKYTVRRSLEMLKTFTTMNLLASFFVKHY